MRRQLHLHEAGFPRDKFLTSYFMDSQDIISILQDIFLYIIWYLTICFWIDWVHVYKYTKIKGLDSSTREITSLPESKKSDEHGMSFRSSLKMKQWKFTTPDQLATPSAPLIEVLLIKILLFLYQAKLSSQNTRGSWVMLQSQCIFFYISKFK